MFTLENVPRYQNSQSFSIILSALEQEGYSVDYSVVNTDHKGCNRSKFADIWLPDGTVKSLSIQGVAILQGFPVWYEFPNETATAGSIIGYSVPPSFATQLFMSAQSPVGSCNCITNLVLPNLEIGLLQYY
ncbi:DNA cytosine methyltransferase [Nostoc sp. C110]|uniref:DNA cytosine methyltransferase n=1 Tax=Nostoc sp. C110 TaxID=3349876 RepID=UPI00370D3773